MALSAVAFIGTSLSDTVEYTSQTVLPRALASTTEPVVAPLVLATTTAPVVPAVLEKQLCNCYLYVKQHYPDLPLTKDLVPNFKPRVGRVALFRYGALNHYAIEGQVIEGEGFYIESENNYSHCKTTYGRFVRFDDPSYLGTWWSDSFEDRYGGG